MSEAEVRLERALARLSQQCNGPLLSLDTSSSEASLALIDRAQTPVIKQVSLSSRALPSEGLFAAIVALVEEAGLSAKDLRALAVGLGPGSFTGLRVGLASAKGIALATNVALIGFNSYLSVALATGAQRVFVVGDARRQSVHVMGVDIDADGQHTTILDVVCLPYALAASRIDAFVQKDQCSATFVGDGVPLVYPHGVPTGAQMRMQPVSAAWGLYSVKERLLRGEADDVATLAPLYLQEMAVPASPARPSFR